MVELRCAVGTDAGGQTAGGRGPLNFVLLYRAGVGRRNDFFDFFAPRDPSHLRPAETACEPWDPPPILITYVRPNPLACGSTIMKTTAKAFSARRPVAARAALGAAVLVLLRRRVGRPAAGRDPRPGRRRERPANEIPRRSGPTPTPRVLTKKFSPDWYLKAAAYAKAGDDALAAGRLVEAADAFRKARWHLPGPARRPARNTSPASSATAGCATPTWSRPSPSAPTADASSPPARTAPSSSGTRRPAASFAATPATPTRCAPSPSAPTASTSPPAARTKRSKSGTPTPARTSNRSPATPISCGASPSALTASIWRPAASDKHVRVYDLSNDSVKFDLHRPQPRRSTASPGAATAS